MAVLVGRSERHLAISAQRGPAHAHAVGSCWRSRFSVALPCALRPACSRRGQTEAEFEVGWQPGDNYRVFAHGLMLFSDSFTHVCDVEGKQDDGTQARLRYRRGAKTLVSA